MASGDQISQNRHSYTEDRYPPHIGGLEFYVRASELEFRIRDAVSEGSAPRFDALFGIKRSGWIIGTFLSHRLELPLFAKSEIASIPSRFEHILIVDTVAWTGRSLRRAFSHLHDAHIPVTHATVLFANPKYRIGDELNLIAGDVCEHVPVFFFHKDFQFGFAHDSDYIEVAQSTDRKRLSNLHNSHG